MITAALQQCVGIGPARLARLHEAGVRTWADCLDHPERIPENWRKGLIAESRRCLAALETEDARYFLDHFTPRDKWRVLHHFFGETTFFDIETEGLEHGAPITVIVCWHQGELHTFVEHENLDNFLALLDEVVLQASFNGSSFDVPPVLDAFHIPSLPCAQLDLRWPCHHQGYVGGLKEITHRMEISRPEDLLAADGQLAVQLWHTWRCHHNRAAREQLIRYCASDVLLLVALAERLTGREAMPNDVLWSKLPDAPKSPLPDHMMDNSAAATTQRVLGAMFGSSSPTQLRGRRPRNEASEPKWHDLEYCSRSLPVRGVEP